MCPESVRSPPAGQGSSRRHPSLRVPPPTAHGRCAAPGTRRRGAVTAPRRCSSSDAGRGRRGSLDLDGGAGALERLLGLVGVVLGDTLEDGLGGRLDEVLGLLEAEAGEAAHLLDDADLLVTGVGEDDVEGGLLLLVVAAAAAGRGRSGDGATGAAAVTPKRSSKSFRSSESSSTVRLEMESRISSLVAMWSLLGGSVGCLVCVCGCVVGRCVVGSIGGGVVGRLGGGAASVAASSAGVSSAGPRPPRRCRWAPRRRTCPTAGASGGHRRRRPAR